MRKISQEQLLQKLDQPTKPVLVEVLAPEQYRKFHLPDAINIPFDDDFDKNVQRAVPDKSTEVVVYCADLECDASPNAAARMDELGYLHVFDYAAGKKDWKDSALPTDVRDR